MQMARLPSQKLLSASMTVEAIPCCASSAATVSPTGPPPAISTGVRAGSGDVDVVEDDVMVPLPDSVLFQIVNRTTNSCVRNYY